MDRRGQTYSFKVNDDVSWTQILTEEQVKEIKVREIEIKKKELDTEFNPYYVSSTQACLPPEYSNNPYIKFGSKHYFTDEDVDLEKE